MRIDCNVFAGNWPFRKIRRNSVESVAELHKKYGISGGYISSLNAIFYNDPTEADIDLAKELENYPNYRQVITVNPALPGACESFRYMIEKLNPAGVRVYPNYHDFTLHSEEFEKVCEIAEENNLPLFLTLRMEDFRAEYMIYSKTIEMWDVCGFIQRHPNFPIVLCGIKCSELAWLVKKIPGQKNFFAETSGMREGEIATERLYENGVSRHMVFGSCAPLFTLLNGLYVFENASVPEKLLEEIMSGRFFAESIDAKYRL